MIQKSLDFLSSTEFYNQGFYTWSNSVTNKAAAVRILKGWSGILLDALNEAKQ